MLKCYFFLLASLVHQGCLVAQTLSIGTVLLQQAAILASFHYNNVEIVESSPDPSVRFKSSASLDSKGK